MKLQSLIAVLLSCIAVCGTQAHALQDASGSKPQKPTLARDENDEDTRLTQQAMMAYWSEIGTVDEYSLSYLISPSALGAADWPSGYEEFLVIRTESSLILATRGLGAPFAQDRTRTGNGFGMELFIEVDGLQDLPGEEVMASQLFPVLASAARQAAAYGGFTQHLDAYGPASIELPLSGGNVSPRWTTAGGSVGAILGAPAQDRPVYVEGTPLSPVRMVPVTILTPDELWAVAYNPPEFRDRLIARLAQNGSGHRSDFDRMSLLTPEGGIRGD